MAFCLRAQGIAFDERVVFAKPRRWRADFIIVGEMIIIECGGLMFRGKGRHK